MIKICAKCLAPTLNYIQQGHDDRGRKFNLYICETCNNFTRDFMLTERETVDEAIVGELHVSLSANVTNDKPAQLTLLDVPMPLRYGE